MAAHVSVYKRILGLLCLSVTHVIVASVAMDDKFTVDDETTLKTALKQNDSTRGTRPERVTLVQLSFTLIAINTVDIKNEQFGVTGWWSMQWHDNRLDWTNRGTHTGIMVLQFKDSEIWIPAIVVDNSVNNLSAIGDSSIPIRVRQDGTVSWNPSGILLTSCEMDVTYFPFDDQICSIQVTSFGYSIQELNMSVRDTGVSTKYFQENGEWTLGSVWNQRKEFTDDGFTYAKLTYFMSLKRRPKYYGLNILLPVLVTSMLIPLVFLLPHDAGEKIGYCLTVLLAYMVLLTIVTDGLPTTAKTQSLLGVFIAVVMSLSGLSVILAIHSLNIFHRSPQRRIPSWEVRLTRSMLAFFRLHCCSAKLTSTHSVSPHPQVDRDENISHSYAEQQQGKKRRSVQLNRANNYAEKGVATVSTRRGKNPEDDLHDNLNSLMHKSKQGMSLEEEGAFMEEGWEEMSWQLVARVYDAFFLRLYLTGILFCCIGFLFASASNQF